jgi:hypothetical protein
MESPLGVATLSVVVAGAFLYVVKHVGLIVRVSRPVDDLGPAAIVSIPEMPVTTVQKNVSRSHSVGTHLTVTAAHTVHWRNPGRPAAASYNENPSRTVLPKAAITRPGRICPSLWSECGDMMCSRGRGKRHAARLPPLNARVGNQSWLPVRPRWNVYIDPSSRTRMLPLEPNGFTEVAWKFRRRYRRHSLVTLTLLTKHRDYPFCTK